MLAEPPRPGRRVNLILILVGAYAAATLAMLGLAEVFKAILR